MEVCLVEGFADPVQRCRGVACGWVADSANPDLHVPKASDAAGTKVALREDLKFTGVDFQDRRSVSGNSGTVGGCLGEGAEGFGKPPLG